MSVIQRAVRVTEPLKLPPVVIEQVGQHIAVFGTEDRQHALAWAQADGGEWRVCWPGTWNVTLGQARHMAHALAVLVATMEVASITRDLTNSPTSDL